MFENKLSYRRFLNLDYNNKIELGGFIKTEPRLNLKNGATTFYFETKRDSGVVDSFHVYVPARNLKDAKLQLGNFLKIDGQIRTENYYKDNKSHLHIAVRANEFQVLCKQDGIPMEDKNDCTLVGFLCKKPIYRETPLGREITDGLLAVENKNKNESYYIPFVAWGRNARYLGNCKIGDKLGIEGRLQSREYLKANLLGKVETKTAYEVSAREVSAFRYNNLTK